MQQFPVDNEVVEEVWKRANPKPFENLSFNSALRRVLELPSDTNGNLVPLSLPPGGNLSDKGQRDDLDQLLDEALAARPRLKAPKADLRELIQAGLLRNGEELYL